MAAFIEDWINRIGRITSWLNVVIIVIIVIDVLFRYLFSETRTWVIELEWQLFALIFLLGMSFTLQQNRHIRVDLFYENFSAANKKRIDLLGNLLFLIPWCLVVIVTGYKYAANSFYIQEGSPNPNGLPYRYIIKSFISLGFVLLLLSGIATSFKLFKSIKTES